MPKNQILSIDASSVIASTWADQFQRRIRDYSGAYKVIIQAFREQVAGELLGNYWINAAGRKMKLKPPHAFGSKNAKKPVFGEDYLAAWRGGAKSIEEISSDSARVGVQGFANLGLHRGGLGTITMKDYRSRDGIAATISSDAQQSTWKLAKGAENRTGARRYAIWWYLLKEYGVALKDETLKTGLKIPMRPHAVLGPKIKTYAVAVISATTAGRPLPAPPKDA